MENEIYCDECNKIMDEGYTIHDGLFHYCSNEYLYENISNVEYEKISDMGFAFWTTFED